MKRISIVAATGLAITLLLLKLPQRTPEAAPDYSEESSAAVASADVRVEHQLVTPEIVQDRPAPASRIPSRLAAAPRARMPHRQPAEPGLLERAKRAFLGDGRHRPEPFPSVRQE